MIRCIGPCGTKKSKNQFAKYNLLKHYYLCKKCAKEKTRQYNVLHKHERKLYRKRHKKEITEYNKQYYIKNKDKEKLRNAAYCKKNKKARKLYSKQYHKKNRRIRCKKQRIYYRNHKDYYAAKSSEYIKKHPDKKREWDRRYREKHKKRLNKRNRDRRKTDINFKIICNLRIRLYDFFKNRAKVGSAIRDLGCSLEKLKIHLARQFYPDKETGRKMTWKNYGRRGWHIDHIRPLCLFDMTNRKQFLKACNYKNLRPLWEKENCSLGGKLSHRKR